MSMGAPKPGSTLPPQGGKGGVRPTQPGFPQQPVNPNIPQPIASLGGKGGGIPTQPMPQPMFPMQPGSSIGSNLIDAMRNAGGQPMPQPNLGFTPQQQPQTYQDYLKSMNPMIHMMPQTEAQWNASRNMPGQMQQPAPGQVPAQGGKTAAPGTIFNPNNPNNVPMPGGKGAGQPDRGVRPPPGQVRPPGMPFYGNPNPETYGSVNNNGVTAQTPMPGQGPFGPFGQQPGIPGQGGKAPLTPEQQAAIANNIDPVRPMPQVSPPQGWFPQRDLGYGNPPPRPQVLPQKPMPANQAQGLMGLKNILAGRR